MLTDVAIKIGDEVVARVRPHAAGILKVLLEEGPRVPIGAVCQHLMRVHNGRTVGLELGPARVEALLDALERRAEGKCWVPPAECQPAWVPLTQARDQAHVPRLTHGELVNLLGAVDAAGSSHPAQAHRKALVGALGALGYHWDENRGAVSKAQQELEAEAVKRGGTVHTDEEIRRVQKMLATETGGEA